MPTIEVVRTYLEMASPADLRGAHTFPQNCVLRRESLNPSGYRQIYAAVGRAYHWRDRDAWSEERLADHLARPEVSVWVLRQSGEPLGFFELVLTPDDGSVEIAYFGLAKPAIGRGLGSALLAAAVRKAWSSGVKRVWLHTCTLDHPAALPNYLARGFRVTHTERYAAVLPEA